MSENDDLACHDFDEDHPVRDQIDLKNTWCQTYLMTVTRQIILADSSLLNTCNYIRSKIKQK